MPEATQFRRSAKRSRYSDCNIHQADNSSMRVYFTGINGLSQVALSSYLKLSNFDCFSPYTAAVVYRAKLPRPNSNLFYADS